MHNMTNPNPNHLTLRSPSAVVAPSPLCPVISAKAETQSSPNPDPSFAKIINPSNPINLVKIFQNSKFNLRNSLKIENSLFEIYDLPILPILTFRPMSAPSGSVKFVKCPRREKQAHACQNMSKTCQKWVKTCQNTTTF